MKKSSTKLVKKLDKLLNKFLQMDDTEKKLYVAGLLIDLEYYKFVGENNG